MKSKWICGWITILLVFCQPVFAENCNVLDESLYYGEAVFYQIEGNHYQPITTIIAGEVLCQYSVIQQEEADIAMIAALYSKGVLIDAQTSVKEVKAESGAVYTARIRVPESQGYEIRLFLVRDLPVTTPMKTVAKLSDKSCAKDVTAFSLDGISGRINQSGNHIVVTVPTGSALDAAVPDVTVSPGASYTLDGTDFSKKVHMTVTAEDESVREYVIETIYANQDNLYDFEDYPIDEGAEKYDKDHWVGPASQNSDIIECITDLGENRVLRLTDNSLSVRADVRGVNWGISTPFTLSCKISYQLPEGVTERTKEDDFSYCTLFAINENTLNLNATDFYFCGFEPVWSSDAFYFHYYKEGKRVKSGIKVIPSAWYDVTMQYYQGTDGVYYTDYTVTEEDGTETTFSAIPSGRTETKLTGLYLLTSPGRRATVLLDDVRIKEDVNFGCEQYEQTFEDAVPEGWSGGTVQSKGNGNVLAINEGQATAKIPEFLGSTGLAFDLCMENPSGTGTLVSFGTEEKKIGVLCYTNGAWGYEREGQRIAFDEQAPITAGKTYRIEIECICDAVYENSRIDFYVDGVKLGSVIPENTPDILNDLCFTAPENGSMDIGNVLVEKR